MENNISQENLIENKINPPSSKFNITSYLELYRLIHKLKHLPRQGWVNNHVPKVEMVASHMYRMTLMAMTAPISMIGDGIDVMHCMKMCLVHDLGESIVGDITPDCKITPEEKFNREYEAMKYICSLIHDQITAESIMSLWMEYEEQKTSNSKFVKDLDRLDMLVQANEYETDYPEIQLDPFWKSTKNTFKSEFAKEIDAHLRIKKDSRENGE